MRFSGDMRFVIFTRVLVASDATSPCSARAVGATSRHWRLPSVAYAPPRHAARARRDVQGAAGAGRPRGKGSPRRPRSLRSVSVHAWKRIAVKCIGCRSIVPPPYAVAAKFVVSILSRKGDVSGICGWYGGAEQNPHSVIDAMKQRFAWPGAEDRVTVVGR